MNLPGGQYLQGVKTTLSFPAVSMRVCFEASLTLEIFLCLILCKVQDTRQFRPDTIDVQYYSRRVLTVTTILIEPYTMYRSVNSSSNPGNVNGIYEGYIVDLMEEISVIIGFRYRLVPVWDGNFGHVTEDGTWDGMIGELVRKEADIAVGPMFITDERAKIVDFTKPFMTVEASIVMRRPPDGRTVEVTSAEDLVRKPHIKYGTLNRGVIRRGFRMTNNTVYRIMWENMKITEHSSFTQTNEEGLERVRKSKYAFILPSTIADYITRQKPCDLIAIDNFLIKKGYGLAVQKGSALLSYLNRAIDQLQRDGTLDKLYKKWWLDRSDCGLVKPSKVFSMSRAPRKTSTADRASVNLLLFISLVFLQNGFRFS